MKLYKLFEEILNQQNDLIPVNVNRFVYHKSGPVFRGKISKEGLIPIRGDQWLSNTPIKGKAVFATNSDDPNEWFDSGYDDDVYKIDTSKIKNKWYLDPNFVDSEEWVEHQGKKIKLPNNKEEYNHIFTFEGIPKEAIKLIHKGSGNEIYD